MSELVITNLTKTFGDNIALDRVSIHARDGEMLTLLGPSGCGKSTTLWSIAGLHQPDQGSIVAGETTLFDPDKKVDLPPEARECGVVFQSYAVWPNMTVAENVGYPLKLRRTRGQARAARVAEVLDLVELGPYADRYPHQLSGGQQQRVALARALAHPPRLLLLDEPFSNLDAKLRERARIWLKDLQRAVEVTTIFVTHDQDEALSMSDRIVVMDRGVVRQVGGPQEIYDTPVDLFVADFIGTINLVAAEVVSETADCAEVRIPGHPSPLLASKATPEPLEGTMTVAVRPEAIVIDPPDDRGLNIATVPVVDRSYLGDHIRYRVRLGEAILTIQTSVAATADELVIGLPIDRTIAFAGAPASD